MSSAWDDGAGLSCVDGEIVSGEACRIAEPNKAEQGIGLGLVVGSRPKG